MSQSLSIALGQINPLLGDIDGNCEKIIQTAIQARDRLEADIIVFPELCITGYPPEDLLLRPQCHDLVERALAQISEAVRDIVVVVGHPLMTNAGLYNCATVLHNEQILARYRKQHLPNYSVFDERRYFTPGTDSVVFSYQGVSIGLAICEDLWHAGPMTDLAAAGAEFVLCLNASPFHQDKATERVSTLHQRQEQEAALPIVYINAVGGQDELVFDGGSMVLSAQGQVVLRAPFFREHLSVCLWQRDHFCEGEVSPLLDELETIYQALVLGTRDYCQKNGFPGALIGLSGGIDSALTLAVACDALGPEKVHAVLMPSRFTADMSNDDALAQAQTLGVATTVLHIEDCMQAFTQTLADVFDTHAADTTEENIQARIRGTLLMALSNKFGKIVLTTGNKSEMAVGYATLYGDMAGGFAVLKDVPKTLVYRLARHRNQSLAVIPERVITRPPSAELRAEQIDQDSLPDYDMLDTILDHYVTHNRSQSEMLAMGLPAAEVKQVIRLIDRNEYKRRQAAPGVRISTRAFGRDWRMPITNGYQTR